MLNFKGWEKIAEDNKTTTLKHEKGHTMTLAHRGLPKIQKEQLKRLKLAEGTPEGTVGDKAQAPVTVNVQSPPQSLQSTNAAPIQVPQGRAVPPVLLPDSSMSAPGAAQASQESIGLNEQIAAQKAKADAAYQKQYLDSAQAQQIMNAQSYQDIKKQTDNMANHILSTPINDKAYLENMGAGKKMLTGIGLLLSGAGSGITGGPNMAMDFLNKQIDRNIDAQKARHADYNTIWGHYHDLYGDSTVATKLATASMNDMLVHQGDLTAAQLGTPIARANALQLRAQKAAENNKLIIDAQGLLKNGMNYPKGAPAPTPDQANQDQINKINEIFPNQNRNVAQNGSLFGMPGSEASLPSKGEGAPESEYNTILKPNAEKLLDNVQFNGEKARQDYPKVVEQYTRAQQVEKQIQQINDLFPKLKEEATLSGDLGKRVNPHALAAAGAAAGAGLGGAAAAGALPVSAGMSALGAPALVGLGSAVVGGLGEGAGHLLKGASKITGGQQEVRYQTDKAGLAKFLIGALGNQATGSEIDDIVENNTPAYWDDAKTYKKKLDNIKKFLINRTETSLIDRYKLTNKSKKD